MGAFMSATLNEIAILDEAARLSAEESIARARRGREALEETLNDCLYHADRRARRSALDESEARVFELVRKAIRSRDAARLESATSALTRHYAEEIGGHYDPTVYAIAEKVLPRFLSVVLSATSLPRLMVRGFRQDELNERIVISGESDQLARLSELGTVVVTPTHGSHMDSPVMAYALNRAGLPPFIYGAGKNLFHNKLLGFFMQNLGAYKVDRLKDEALYKRTLKNYCVTTLRHGLPNLFFPGGTRSRSGAIEHDLKLGLLGCGLEAFIRNLQDDKPKPRVFIVPATVTYHLVLEAETLIDDYLKDEGKSRYIIDDDEFTRAERIASFVSSLLAMDGQIHVRFGRALDPFGNEVDSRGESLDPHGRAIDPRDYVLDAEEKPVLDAARDRQYTRELGSAIARSLRKNNTILPTHVLAFALLHELAERVPERDLYRALRTVNVQDGIEVDAVLARVERVLEEVRKLSSAGQLHASHELLAGAREVLTRAEQALTLYHLPHAIERKGDRYFIGDAGLVYFYHNRLTGYGLDTHSWLVPRAKKGNRK
jgi:glycerol-3-phosphate O-acyltransferase